MTITKEIIEKMENAKQYVGKPAMVHTTHYYDSNFGSKPIIEIQTNIVKDIVSTDTNARTKWEYALIDGRDTKGFGSLGACPSRHPDRVFHTVEDVLEETKKKIKEHESYQKISETKDNYNTGDQFLAVHFSPYKGEFSVGVIKVKNYSVQKGFTMSPAQYTLEHAYAKNEIYYLLEEVENYVSKILPYKEDVLEKTINEQKYIVTVVNADNETDTLVLDSTHTKQEVIAKMKQQYGYQKCIIVAFDTEKMEIIFKENTIK